MNSAIKFGLLATGMGLAMHMADAQAIVASHYFISNAVNYCQAFTPGPANTIRNRVVGAENVGTTPIALACDYHTMQNGAAGATVPTDLYIYFANDNASGTTLTVTCTLLTGYQGQSSAYTVTKTTNAIAGGGTAQVGLSWHAADNPTSGATDLGNSRIGINCTLPPGAVANASYLYWNMDNGVGS